MRDISRTYFTSPGDPGEYALDVEERFEADIRAAEFERNALRRQLKEWYDTKYVYVNDEAEARSVRGPWLVPI